MRRKSGRAVGLQQSTGYGPVRGRPADIAWLEFHQRPIIVTQKLAAEDSADVSDPGHLPWLEQLPPHRRGQRGQFLCRLAQNTLGHGIALLRGLVHQAGKGSNTLPRKLGGVEAVQKIVGGGGAGGFQKKTAQSGLRPPAFLLAKRGAESLARQVEGPTLIVKNIAPAPARAVLPWALRP